MAGDPSRIRDLVDRAIAAHDALADVGAAIEDEWSYVDDLRAAWGDRLNEVVSARGDERADPAAEAAVEAAIVEVGRIADPHRAIDWLSTFPQVVLLAIGERT